ncbi:MAG: CotH kinase family protein [Chloroflexi bacterium]|nr:CotH kinase family protein [Chloroflexota bacterium]
MVRRDSGPFYDDRVATVRIVMPGEDWDWLRNNARDEQYVKADMWFDGELIPDIAIRPKGNSSLSSTIRGGSIRFGLKADLNFFNSARHLRGVKKLNFNNGFSDPTLMREVLAYDLFAQMGVPAPRASFVDLWLNDTHLGLYTTVEQVDKSFLSRHFVDSAGNLYKPVAPAAYLNWTEEDLVRQQAQQATPKPDDNAKSPAINLGGGKLGEIERALGLQESLSGAPAVAAKPQLPNFRPPGGVAKPEGQRPPPGLPGGQPPGMAPGARQPFPGMQGGQRNYLEGMGLRTNENSPNHQALLHFLQVLNKEPGSTFQEEIERVLNVDQVLRFLAVSTALVHLDNYTGQFGHNYYLYEIDGRFTVIPWDLNMSFGTFNSGLDRQRIVNFYADEPTAGPVADRPLVARLLSVPSYLETYHQYLTQLITGPISVKVMEAKIDRLANMIRPHVQADTLKFTSTDEFERSLGAGGESSGGGFGMRLNIGLKSFVAERVESIEKQLDGTLPSKSGDGSGNGGSWRFRGLPGM